MAKLQALETTQRGKVKGGNFLISKGITGNRKFQCLREVEVQVKMQDCVKAEERRWRAL